MWRRYLLTWVFLALLWTNPSTNEDGTPCTDLSMIRILMTHKESGQSHSVFFPLWHIPDDGSGQDSLPPFGVVDTVWRSHPGLPDSVANLTLPPATAPYDWWRITIFGIDFAGNESDSSNTISVTAPENE